MKKEYNIKLPDGAIVPVTEEVYRAYKRPQWREASQRKSQNKRKIPVGKCVFQLDVHKYEHKNLKILKNIFLNHQVSWWSVCYTALERRAEV